jgi:hypothetical protein
MAEVRKAYCPGLVAQTTGCAPKKLPAANKVHGFLWRCQRLLNQLYHDVTTAFTDRRKTPGPLRPILDIGPSPKRRA